MIAAVSREAPDLILAPMLKIAIPKEIWSRHLCLIVHPGIRGDRGPSSLDWAIANHEKSWGVTILEAAEEFDAGAIWASHEFAVEEILPRRAASIAVRSPRRRCAAFSKRSPESNRARTNPAPGSQRSSPMWSAHVRGRLRPPMRQADRAIDWTRDKTATIVRKIRAADSAPGVLGTLLGKSCFLYGAHAEDRLQGAPGQVLARRDGAICIGTSRWRCLGLASEGQG